MTKQEVSNLYKKFRFKNNYVRTSEDLHIYALGKIEDIEESINTYKKELKDNKKMKHDAMFRNLLPFIFQAEDTSIYEKDNELIESILLEMNIRMNDIKRLINLINDDNKDELLKLLEFIVSNYSDNVDYLEKEREVLEFTIQNIILYNENEDKRKETNEYIEEMLNKLEIKGNNIEKKKKI